MGDKNMTFTKEGGLRVGVKQVAEEEYVGKTRSVFVKAWNLGTGADADGERPPSTPGSNRYVHLCYEMEKLEYVHGSS